MMKQLLLLLGLSPLGLLAQQEVVVNDMTFSYQLLEQEIIVELSAPTTGWIGLGFNTENNIVGSDLLLFHVVKGSVEGNDLFVKSFGNPKLDSELGGTNDIHALSGTEKNGWTSVRFKLPLPSKDSFDFQHRKGQSFWLILAYSTHDDFNHHSRMRKHVQVELVDGY